VEDASSCGQKMKFPSGLHNVLDKMLEISGLLSFSSISPRFPPPPSEYFGIPLVADKGAHHTKLIV